jgi:predicted DNA-binding transcriptional regulator AlpA
VGTGLVLLDPGDVAEMLRIPRATLAAWRYRGRGPRWLRVGRHVRYLERDVEAWLESLATQPTADR